MTWEPIKREPDYDFECPEEWTLTGHFEAVPGYSTNHTGVFSITRYELVRGEQDPTE